MWLYIIIGIILLVLLILTIVLLVKNNKVNKESEEIIKESRRITGRQFMRRITRFPFLWLIF